VPLHNYKQTRACQWARECEVRVGRMQVAPTRMLCSRIAARMNPPRAVEGGPKLPGG
jgi:hypothetical protein